MQTIFIACARSYWILAKLCCNRGMVLPIFPKKSIERQDL